MNGEVGGSNPHQGHNCASANSVIMSALTVHCRWEDEMVREITGHPPFNAMKMKSLTLHAHGCL